MPLSARQIAARVCRVQHAATDQKSPIKTWAREKAADETRCLRSFVTAAAV